MEATVRTRNAVDLLYLNGQHLVAAGVDATSARALEAGTADLALAVDVPTADARLLLGDASGTRTIASFSAPTAPVNLQGPLQRVALAANTLCAAVLEAMPAERRDRFGSAIDAGQATFTVQLNWRAGELVVLVDGPNWAAPQCLLAWQLPQEQEH